MSEENKQLVRRWFEEVWNQQREETIDELFAPEGEAYGFPEPDSVLTGPESFKTIYRQFLEAFPDIHFTIRQVISEGDLVAITWTATMTHLGNGLGFPATIRRESLDGCSILEIRGPQIQSGRNYMEMYALIHRLKNGSPADEEDAALAAS